MKTPHTDKLIKTATVAMLLTSLANIAESGLAAEEVVTVSQERGWFVRQDVKPGSL